MRCRGHLGVASPGSWAQPAESSVDPETREGLGESTFRGSPPGRAGSERKGAGAAARGGASTLMGSAGGGTAMGAMRSAARAGA